MARNNKRANGKGRAQVRNVKSRCHPPQIRANVELSHRYRFTSSASTAKTITPSLLLNAAGLMATTTTAGTTLYQAVRLKRVTIWSPPASQGAAATCSVFWTGVSAGVIGGRDTEVSDTSMSVAEPAHVSSVPPANSLASFWNNDNNTSLMVLVAPAGSVIDIQLQLILGDGVASNATPAVLVAATVGVVYYGALDNVTKAAAIYLPVSLTCL